MTAVGMRRIAAAAALAAVSAAVAAGGADSGGAVAGPQIDPAPAAVSAGLAHSSDPVRAAEYWIDDYGIRDAWKTTRGKGVKIAIIDTGIGKGPAEFEGAVVGGTDVSGLGSADGRTPVGSADSDHGSWVASLAAARGAGKGKGMIGVAPDAELLSISVGFGSSATTPFTDQIAEAMRWAVDNGADVINLSLTTNRPDWDESWDDAFLHAFDNDVVVVVAAGNRGAGTTRVGAPATIPGVLTVAGVDRQGRASVEASTQGITLGVAAPSEELVGVSADGRVVDWRGTSGAAPIVAGVVALVRAAHPDLDAANVINRIVETARLDSGKTSLLYGHGLVDAKRAVSATVERVDENPMGSLSEWIRVFRRAASQPSDEPSVGPVDIPSLPPAEPPTAAGSPLLPTPDTIRYGTLPLIVVTVPAILIGLGVTAAVRRIRSARSSGASSS
ncbi:MAG: S8 family serine peptidase [Microbacterium sp.]|uniref:S8 family peptidase n=1 Tax=Microbacterium sp. TaxID=51671 RepID=UPI0039E7261B